MGVREEDPTWNPVYERGPWVCERRAEVWMPECEGEKMQGVRLRERGWECRALEFGNKTAQSHHGPKHHVQHSFQPQLRGALLG